MVKIRKYKSFIAVALVALYAFVATPVQLWHHHSYAVSSAAFCAAIEKGKSAISKSSGKLVESNCQICSHQYSVYSDVTASITGEPISPLRIKEGNYIFSIQASCGFILPNKGPPSLS